MKYPYQAVRSEARALKAGRYRESDHVIGITVGGAVPEAKDHHDVGSH